MTPTHTNDTTYGWSETQHQRLKQLGADKQLFLEFSTPIGRDSAYQEIEKELVKSARSTLSHSLTQGGNSQYDLMCNRVSEALIGEGFLKVTTPTVISARALEKMTINADHPLYKQVFWLNKKQCLRPMLAPNLYSLMQDFSRQKPRPIRFFEIGSCYRKETDGTNHTSEFTMLNLVEMGLPVEERETRLLELGSLVAKSAGLSSYKFETEDSEVYGNTVDMVSGEHDIEIASGAMGPHPLDNKWGIHDTWVGMGIGIERMLMLLNNDSSISKWCKSISYFDGITLKI